MNSQAIQWFNAKEKLPKIPEGKHAVRVLVISFDSVFEEISPGHGCDFTSLLWTTPKGCNKPWFCDLCIGRYDSGFYYHSDYVIAWAYEPEVTDEMKELAKEYVS